MTIGIEAAGWRTLDLFCGAAGGWTLGLHRAGFVTVAACEIDPWRRAVFGRNNPGVRPYEDVRTLGADRLRGDLGFLPEIVCGSPPCQDASAANAKGRGVDGERTGLFFEAVRLVREVRPRWVLLENVPGLRTRGYDRVHDAMEEAGYAVWPLVVGAVHTGAPHLRKRVWIVAADAERDEGRWFEQVRRAAERSAFSTGSDARGNAADTQGIGCGQAVMAEGRERPAHKPQVISAFAATVQRPSLARCESDGNRTEAAADTGSQTGWRDRAGRRQSQSSEGACAGIPGDAARSQRRPGDFPQGDRPESGGDCPIAAWGHWNGGPPDLGRVDDGISEALAFRRGIGRACLAAYGDAVLPQITETIGRAIRSLDRAEC